MILLPRAVSIGHCDDFRAAAAAPGAPAAPDLQITVHRGQDGALLEPVREVFRRFGAAGIEHFAATHSANRAFGPAGPRPGGAEPE